MIKSIILSISRSLFVSIILIGASYNIILGDKEVQFHQLSIFVNPNNETIAFSDSSYIKFIDGSNNGEKLIKKVSAIINAIHSNTLAKCKLQKVDGRVPYEVKKDINNSFITLNLNSPNILDLEICKDEVINKIKLMFEDERAKLLQAFNEHKSYKLNYEVSMQSFSIFSNLQQLLLSGKKSENEILELHEKFTQQTIDYQNKLYKISEQKIRDFIFLSSINYEFSTIKENKASREQSLVILVFFSLFILLTLLDIKFIQKLSLRKIIYKFFK